MLMTEIDMPKIFEVKMLQYVRRSSQRIVADLELVASAVEGSDLGPTEDPLSLQQVASVTPKKRASVTCLLDGWSRAL